MKKTFLLMLILCYSFLSYSQLGLIRKETDKKGVITFAELRSDSAPQKMCDSKKLLKQMLVLDQDEDFVLTDSKTDKLGYTNQYFDQH